MAQIKLEIKSCKECKHIKTVGRWGSDSWERMEDWFCTEKGKDVKIQCYVGWNDE